MGLFFFCFAMIVRTIMYRADFYRTVLYRHACKGYLHVSIWLMTVTSMDNYKFLVDLKTGKHDENVCSLLGLQNCQIK